MPTYRRHAEPPSGIPVDMHALYYLYHRSIMRELEDALLLNPGRDGQPLPSVRALAAHHGVTPLTMHRALRHLAQDGRVHAIPRKGFFWGTRPPSPPPLAAPAKARLEDVRNRLLEDLRRGVFHPHRPLPDPRSLGEIHGMGARRMAALLATLVEQGWLVRRGRTLYTAPPVELPFHSTVLVVSRCDHHGMLLLDSERETDFLKSIRLQARELGLEPSFAGWHEDGTHGRLLDRDGNELRLENIRGPLLGIVASTWLVLDPVAMLRDLRQTNTPVAVWWEHPAEDFPKGRTGSMVGFNLSFGTSAGWEAGRHLRSLAEGTVAFVSPFHASEWSRARLEGLQQALEGSGIQVVPCVDETWESAWHIRQAAGGVKEGEDRIRETLSEFLHSGRLDTRQTWVTVNDHVALYLIELLREAGMSRPRIVSFDNTSASEAWQFDSFEFHTDGMVRQMLHQILHPDAKMFRDGGLHEMMGRMVVRQPRSAHLDSR